MYCFVDRKLEEITFNQHSLNAYVSPDSLLFMWDATIGLMLL